MTDARRRVLHVITLVAILSAFWWNQDRGLKAVAHQTHEALCSFKKDLEVRRDHSARYLIDIKGEFIFGIPREVVETSVANQTATLESLEPLRC